MNWENLDDLAARAMATSFMQKGFQDNEYVSLNEAYKLYEMLSIF